MALILILVFAFNLGLPWLVSLPNVCLALKVLILPFISNSQYLCAHSFKKEKMSGLESKYTMAQKDHRIDFFVENLFNLKFTSKQLLMNSKKSSKEETAEKAKLKRAIQQGDAETAKIYAENAIRKKNESLNYLRLAARIDSVASRVQSAINMKRVTSSMASVVKNMDKALESMNLEKISNIMEKFESQFEDLDIQTQYTESSISNTNALVTPENQVYDLIHQVADEHQLELNDEMVRAPSNAIAAAPKTKDEADLNERLAKLRSMDA